MALTSGSKAPDFSLKTKSAAGISDFHLSEAISQGNVVLLFFPAAFTGVCTQEFCSASDNMHKYQTLNAQVVGISTDQPFAQEAWANAHKISVTLCSDYNREVIRKYDVVLENFLGIGDFSARAAFVIDRNGTIVYAEQTPTPGEVPSFEAIEQALKGLN